MKPGETLLLIAALPVLVPSLTVNFIGCKVWGRIDALILTLDAGLLMYLCRGSGPLLGWLFAAWIASELLWLSRRDKLEQGIFLGYSNAVAMRLVAGGVLLGLGVMFALPFSPAAWKMLPKLLTFEKSVTAGALLAAQVPQDRPVRVTDGRLDWSRKVAVVEAEAGRAFYREDPRPPLSLASLDALWERRGELVGRKVSVPVDAAPHATLDEGFRYSISANPGKKVAESSSAPSARYLSLLREFPTGIANVPFFGLWYAAPAGGEPLLAGTTVTATLGVVAGFGQEFNRGFWTTNGRGPSIGSVLVPDADPVFKGMATWVPVADTMGGLWLAFPGEAPEDPDRAVTGIYVGPTGMEGFPEYAQGLFGSARTSEPPRVILAARRWDYLHRVGAGATRDFSFLLLLLVPGLLCLAWGAAVAARE